MQSGIYELGDRGITFQFSGPPSPTNHAHLRKMKAWIDTHPFSGLQDVILSYQSLTLLIDRFLLLQSGITDIKTFLTDVFLRADQYAVNTNVDTTSRILRIPVCYDVTFGFDLETMSLEKGISVNDIIALHTQKEYTVYMIGFLPGFPYLGFVDDRISFARKNSPRATVPAGSVGIAGKQTGIYPLDSPGGWQIVGRTPDKLFDSRREPPVELQPGDRVQFYEISLAEFHTLSQPT